MKKTNFDSSADLHPIKPPPSPTPVNKISGIMQFFSYSHLPKHLQDCSIPFCKTAEWVDKEFPDNPEKEMALRKLLEAKDCAVRSALYKENT